MDIDLDALLSPVSAEAPAGPDLSYDPDFLALEQAAQGKSEQQFGDTIIPAEEPDWQDVRRRAEALLMRSKDLRVSMLLTRALVRLDNAEGLAAGLELIRAMLDRYWDTLHPELDRDDNNDPTMRLNALGPLGDASTLLRDIRNAFVVASPQHGRVAFRDVLVLSGKLPSGGAPTLSESEINGTLRAAFAEDQRPAHAALKAAASLTALESLLNEKGVLSQAPDLQALRELLHAATPLINAALGVESNALAVGEGSVARAQTAGQLTSRDDAIRALENVCRFIEQSEPSNPAPLLIRRAQRLIGRRFVEIIEDLAPESLGQIQKLAGLEPK
jgi:type VI secretion system protein ImpA